MKRLLAVLGAWVLMTCAHVCAAQGFYVRGDFGWNWSTNIDITDQGSCVPATALIGCNSHVKGDYDSPLGAVGVGFQPLSWLRTDATLTYSWDGNFSGDATAPVHVTSDVETWTGLVNGYIELNGLAPPGTFGPFRPYLDAGIGASHNRVSHVRGLAVGRVTILSPGGSNTSFAWALGAGVGYELSDRLTIDLGYRYMDLGKLEADAGTATAVGVASGPVRGTEGDLAVHALMLGVRWRL